MKLQDAVFNWLQIRIVADARPDDLSAIDTVDFFFRILTEDHKVTDLSYSKDATMYTVRYLADGKLKTQMFPIELAEQLLEAIENEPTFHP